MAALLSLHLPHENILENKMPAIRLQFFTYLLIGDSF